MTLSSVEPLLRSGAADLNVPLSDAQFDALLRLITELTDWSARFNLTAIRAPADIVRKHLLDSLSIHPYLHAHSIADVGSGPGFPGLPLAIANPHRTFTLIESTGKKARFIQHAVDVLRLPNVRVVNARAEAWQPPQLFDAVLSRALGKLPEFVRWTAHFCGRDGRWLAMKGKYPQEEIDALPKGWRVVAVHPLQVPGLDAERHLIELAAASPEGARALKYRANDRPTRTHRAAARGKKGD